MYIGPWQEYRLAKIQDGAIQRLRKEWEDQLREQIPEGDEARFRDTRADAADDGEAAVAAAGVQVQEQCRLLHASREARDVFESSVVCRECCSTGVAAKKKAAPQRTALEEAQRRKEMFSKWIKTAATVAADPGASSTSVPTTPALSGTDVTTTTSSSSSSAGGVVLPRIHQPTGCDPEAGDLATYGGGQERDHEDARLPPIRQPAAAAHEEWEFLKPYEPSQSLEETAAAQPPDLEDSLDEDEANSLLNWTDTLLSPNALGFPSLEDDDLDLGQS